MSSGDRLCECVSRGDAVAVIALLDSGVDPNYPSKLDGWTPLHWACKQSNIHMVSLLLSRGADTTIKTRSGLAARDLTSSFEIVALLQANESPSISPDYRSDRLPYDLPHNMVNKSEQVNQHSVQVIKVRIANSTDTDFIEIELPTLAATYLNLVKICCQELGITPEQVHRIRKLPDTRIRCDADVRRLKPLQELEVVLRECPSVLNMVSTNIYPSISTNKNQTVLY
ncbi:ankyrin repeat domain-containing protein 40-like [Arctopsyche grandis]|uniref:ankyrin repeat domain-containing protein 40-like n=1 Tax=Arctopsyche grandis TaxID=121162 RepID=UPI00406D9CD3